MIEMICSRCGSPLAHDRLAGQCPRCLAALAFGDADAPESGSFFRAGDYTFLRELGRGGMGIVYEAVQGKLNRRVAVKLLPGGGLARPESLRRFRGEAEAVARLRHPRIVTVYEVGELEGQPFLAMELIVGPSLAELVQAQPLAPRRAVRYVRLVAEAIAHAHAAGVLHRDLKPSNILLDADDQPRVTDFGLAKLLDSAADLTRTGEVLGSPNYLPPEQVAGGPVGVAGDVYSLGAILYQLLTARPPFAADSVAATLQQVMQREPASPRLLNAAVPRDLETICLKCLHKEPGRRYAGVAELAAELARFEAGEPIQGRPVARTERLLLWCRRKPALAGVTMALTITALAGLVGVLSQWRRAEVSRAETARHLYAADVAAAASAMKDGNLGRARELLVRHLPGRAEGRARAWREAGAVYSEATEFAGRLLWARCQGDDLAILGTHPWIVTCVAVSPDGRWAASGSQDQPDDRTHCLKLWRLPGADPGQISERTLGALNTIWSVAFTADSRTLVSSGVNGVRFWDVATGALRSEFPDLPGQELALAGGVVVASPNHPFFSSTALEPLQVLDLETRTVRPLAIRGRHPALSPDGRQLAVLDSGRNLRLHDLATERLLATVATNHLVFRLRFSPDGTRLAAAGQMTAAKVWNLAAPGSAPLVFRSPHNVWDAAFTPDGVTLVTAGSHQQLEVWDAATATPRGVLSGHDNEVWTVAATRDGRQLISGGKDQTVRLWPVAASRDAPAVPAWRYARPQFSPDGRHLLTYSQTNWQGAALVWKLPAVGSGPQSKPRRTGAVSGYPRGFAPDATNLLFFRSDRAALDWRAAGSGEVIRSVELAGAPTQLVLSEFALAGDARSFACPDETGAFGRWSTEDGRLLRRWEDAELAGLIRKEFAGGKRPNRLFRGFAAGRTGRWLAVGPFGAYAGVLVDFESGTAVRLRGHRDDIAALAFSPDDRLLATGSVDGTIRVWEVPSGRFVTELPGHLESVEAVAFSPDGQTLASVNPGIEVTFWHLPTRRELARLPHPEAGYHVAFSPDGRRLALSATAGNLETDTDRVEWWDAP